MNFGKNILYCTREEKMAAFMDPKITALLDEYSKVVNEVQELRSSFDHSQEILARLREHPDDASLLAVAESQPAIKSRLSELQDILLQLEKEAKGLDIFLKLESAGQGAQ
jgi:hypothetical protein